MSLKSVKAKIKSINKTRQVTRAMEAVSAVKMRKSQAYAISLRPYAMAALHILEGVSSSQDAKSHPLMAKRPEKKTLVVVVSPDKGLAGSLVTNVLRRTTKLISEIESRGSSPSVVAIGKKAVDYFSKRSYPVVAHYEKWGDLANFIGIEPLAKTLASVFLKEECDTAYIVFTNFRSTLTQEVVVRQILPLQIDTIREIVQGIAPVKGRFSLLHRNDDGPIPSYLFEPSPEVVLNLLLPKLIATTLFHIVLESNASEHSARMIAMKNASDNAKELSRKLSLKYNKARQAAITREVSEIVGGMESLKEVGN